VALFIAQQRLRRAPTFCLSQIWKPMAGQFVAPKRSLWHGASCDSNQGENAPKLYLFRGLSRCECSLNGIMLYQRNVISKSRADRPKLTGTSGRAVASA
jgi:hypothetical protein